MRLARTVEGAEFAAGQVVTILEDLSGGRCRIAYGDVTDMTVPASMLVPVETTSAQSPEPSKPGERSRDRLTATQHRALAEFAVAGDRGLTDAELADGVGVKVTSIAKHRAQLLRAGLIAETSERRPSPTGGPSVVWRVTDLGVRVWRDHLADAA